MRAGRQVDHSHPNIAKFSKTWASTSTPYIRLHGAVLNRLSTGTTLPYSLCTGVNRQKRA
jgi:hypothetical protein